MAAGPTGQPRSGAPGARAIGMGVVAVAGRPAYRLLFVLLTVGMSLIYTILLPFSYTQRFSVANWAYLAPETVGFAVGLGVGLAAVLTLQLYASRRAAAARKVVRAVPGGAAGMFGFLASVAPGLLCCSPLLPSLLAAAGLSGMTLITTAGNLQYFFAVHETAILTGSLILVLATGAWSAHRITRAACLQPGGACPTPAGGRAAGNLQPEPAGSA